jgi:hypothetical protein|tara:strand:+ start:452 stop:760 length:309 start_codon:yes stop_codon:yes gene_type:complete
MKNKKSNILMDNLGKIILLAIGIFVITLIILRFTGEGASDVDSLRTSTNDYDGDGIPNYFDNCDCDTGSESNDGCPDDADNKEKIDALNKECKEKMQNQLKT